MHNLGINVLCEKYMFYNNGNNNLAIQKHEINNW